MLEKLLAAVTALTAAIEKLIALQSSGTTSMAAAAPSNPAAAAPAAVTIEQVREKMKELMDKKGKEAVVAVLASVGAKKLGDVKPEALAATYSKAEAALAVPAAEPSLF